MSRCKRLVDYCCLDKSLDIGRFTGPQFIKDFELQKRELFRLGVWCENDFKDSEEPPTKKYRVDDIKVQPLDQDTNDVYYSQVAEQLESEALTRKSDASS